MSETLQFGLTMLAAGMGGTILTLLALAGIIRVLSFVFPPEERAEDGASHKENSP